MSFATTAAAPRFATRSRLMAHSASRDRFSDARYAATGGVAREEEAAASAFVVVDGEEDARRAARRSRRAASARSMSFSSSNATSSTSFAGTAPALRSFTRSRTRSHAARTVASKASIAAAGIISSRDASTSVEDEAGSTAALRRARRSAR
eukprot:31497-Pelagococcus_subviridis.AAC.2